MALKRNLDLHSNSNQIDNFVTQLPSQRNKLDLLGLRDELSNDFLVEPSSALAQLRGVVARSQGKLGLLRPNTLPLPHPHHHRLCEPQDRSKPRKCFRSIWIFLTLWPPDTYLPLALPLHLRDRRNQRHSWSHNFPHIAKHLKWLRSAERCSCGWHLDYLWKQWT